MVEAQQFPKNLGYLGIYNTKTCIKERTCECVPPELLQRLTGNRNNMAETQHSQKKLGVTQK